ncbi:MAG: ribonuclease E inhibitor RraB [Phycisphaerales bacterium]
MSSSKPSMKFDIDALFDHMVGNLSHQMDQEMDWTFVLRSTDLARLERLGEKLSDEFIVELQEEVETHEGGRVFMGPPMLSITSRAAHSRDEVKSLADRFAKLAAAEKVTYEGVSCYEPTNADELFDWLGLDDAKWRLRALTDSGLEEGEELPFVFAIAADNPKHAKAVAKAIRSDGIEQIEIAEDEGESGVIVHIDGSNSETALVSAYERIARLAQQADAELLGIQFGGDEEGGDDEGDDDADEDEESDR